GDDEEQVGVVVDQGRAGHLGVSVTDEEVEVATPDLGGFHGSSFTVRLGCAQSRAGGVSRSSTRPSASRSSVSRSAMAARASEANSVIRSNTPVACLLTCSVTAAGSFLVT